MVYGIFLKKDVRTYGESVLLKGGMINILERKRIIFEGWCVNFILT